MPALTTPDGQPVEAAPVTDLPAADKEQANRDFSRAMAADDPSAVQGPPRRPDQPAGEQPRKRRGRPPKNPDEKARASEKPAGTAKGAPAVNYAEAAAGLVTAGWATCAGIPWTMPYAAVIDANADQLVTALANGAEHNDTIRTTLEKAASGGGGVWMVQLAAVSVNMTMMTMQIMRDPEVRRGAAEVTRAKFREFLIAQGVSVPGQAPAEAADAPVAA